MNSLVRWRSAGAKILEWAEGSRIIPIRFLANFLTFWLAGASIILGIADLPQEFAEYHSDVLPVIKKLCHIVFGIFQAIAALALLFTVYLALSFILAVFAVMYS